MDGWTAATARRATRVRPGEGGRAQETPRPRRSRRTSWTPGVQGHFPRAWCLHLLVVRALDVPEAVKDVDRLAQCEPKVAPIQRDVAEADEQDGPRPAAPPATRCRVEGEAAARGSAPAAARRRGQPGDRRRRPGLDCRLSVASVPTISRGSARAGRGGRSDTSGIVSCLVRTFPKGGQLVATCGSRMALPSPAAPRRSVLMIGSEASPFSKTGGLADVLGACRQRSRGSAGTSRSSRHDIEA